MKINYCSDLHLEFRDKVNIFKPNADVLCLAGDICACGTKEDFAKFIAFLKWVTPQYKYVIHVAGNHEYYTVGETKITIWNTMQEINKRFKRLSTIFKNYIFLNNEVVVLTIGGKKYGFIGTVLWADVNPKDYKELSEYINDYHNIYVAKSGKPVKFTIQDMTSMFKKNRLFLAKAVEMTKKTRIPYVLITHHKPIADTKDRDIFTQAYEVNVAPMLKQSRIKLAIHGHTHKHYNRTLYGIQFVSNPKGYVKQQTFFEEALYIEI
jgi:predicted phosphohydrolase